MLHLLPRAPAIINHRIPPQNKKRENISAFCKLTGQEGVDKELFLRPEERLVPEHGQEAEVEEDDEHEDATTSVNLCLYMGMGRGGYIHVARIYRLANLEALDEPEHDDAAAQEHETGHELPEEEEEYRRVPSSCVVAFPWTWRHFAMDGDR